MCSSIATEKEMEIERAVKRGYSECMKDTIRMLDIYIDHFKSIGKKEVKLELHCVMNGLIKDWNQKYNSEKTMDDQLIEYPF